MKARLALAGALAALSPAAAADFGADAQALLTQRAPELFGIAAPLAASAAETDGPQRGKDQPASAQVALAAGLTAEYLTRGAANHLDMMAFFPAENPTHLIGCIEAGEDDKETLDGRTTVPSVQSIGLTDGTVRTLLRGMEGCDGIRTTPWGTILATEETDDGGAYELMDPLAMDQAEVRDRATGETTDPAHVAKRTALPTMAWEGLTLTAEGVVYGGDELRPGTDTADIDGGAMFKFIPATTHAGGPIASLNASPLVAGKTYAMQVACQKDKVQFGQGCEVGSAAWVEVDPARARSDAAAKGATGYYRPEDLHDDAAFAGEGIRFCWTNTGNEGANNFGEVLCATDSAPLTVPAADAEGKIAFSTRVSRFIAGDADFNSFDNLAFQPGSGNLYVIEDHPNGDVFACLRDGADRDVVSDGCIRVLSVTDSSAEPTGFVFAPDGSAAYLSIQHSDDANMEKADGFPTDDLLKITGFQPVQ